MESKTYKIETVADFMNVPLDRLTDCLAEFYAFLVTVHVAKWAAASLNEPIEAGSCFTWIDDGKTDINIHYHDIKTGEKVAEVKL